MSSIIYQCSPEEFRSYLESAVENSISKLLEVKGNKEVAVGETIATATNTPTKEVKTVKTLITRKEFMAFAKISATTFDSWQKAGHITTKKIGQKVYVLQAKNVQLESLL